MTQLHTILGASGAIGRAVVHELQRKGINMQAVERTAKLKGINTIQADLLNRAEAIKAIQGSTHVYLCVGLPYSADVWRESWPLLMQNVIDACLATDAILIFLDNIYMYGPAPLSVPFDENHLQNPTSKKGLIRKQTVNLLLKAIETKKLNAVVGRSADFYGPYAVNSLLYFSFSQRMLQGKSPQSIARAGIKHTYAYSVDVGKALVALALDTTTYGQIWHLPVGEPVTVEEIAAIFNKEFGTNFKTSFLHPLMFKILSLFISPLKETAEMLYQFDSEYIMSFAKFEKQFPGFKVTPYESGIREMIKSFKEDISLKTNV